MAINPIGPQPVTSTVCPAIAGQHGVHRVSQRIENRAVMFGNCRVQLPDIRRRNFHELRERAVLVDADNPQILANVRFA